MATAINEMAATTQEVASNVALAADATREASRLTVHGREVTAETRKAIQQLSDSVAKTGEAVNQLASDSEAIGSVVDVIKSTPIRPTCWHSTPPSARRAPASGRGFAVVADEVRQLAQRTGAATGEIHQLIEKLQQQARHAVQTTEAGRAHASRGVEQVLQPTVR